jgi:hypothetical protein
MIAPGTDRLSGGMMVAAASVAVASMRSVIAWLRESGGNSLRWTLATQVVDVPRGSRQTTLANEEHVLAGERDLVADARDGGHRRHRDAASCRALS